MRLENIYTAVANKTIMDGMSFRDTYPAPEAVQILYELLEEREPYQAISHRELPTLEDHAEFVESDPYKAWFLIEVQVSPMAHEVVGAIYLTHQNEIGIQLFKNQTSKGYGEEAVRMLMDAFEGPFLANISPENDGSMRFFEKLGAKKIQFTYKLEATDEKDITCTNSCVDCKLH